MISRVHTYDSARAASLRRWVVTVSVLLCTSLLCHNEADAQRKAAKAANRPAALRIAVLEFISASSDKGLEVLGKGLQSMVTTDLSKVESLTIVERARLQAIFDEQKLGRSGAIDKRTAAKIGKLAGASHLLSGTFTVHGDNMRIDARLFSVKGGEVLLAEEMTGERDAFFELEKDLVRKLVRTLGVKLAPKERAGIARIHTADFKAFRRFSEGVAYFDEARYQEALSSLRQATELDGEFNLARVTLGEYEQVVAQIRARATQIENTQKELAALKRDAVAQADAAVAERLYQIAGNKQADISRQLSAIDYLLGFHNPFGRNHGRIMRFQDLQDGFSVRRIAAGLAQRYLNRSMDDFPEVLLFPSGSHPPKDTVELEERVEGHAGSIVGRYARAPRDRERQHMKNLLGVERFIKLVPMSVEDRIRVYEMALNRMDRLRRKGKLDDPEFHTRSKGRILDWIHEEHLALGDLDAASGALASQSALSTSPRDLQVIAEEIEVLGTLAKERNRLPRGDKQGLNMRAAFTELIALDRLPRSESSRTKLFASGASTLPLLRELRRARKLDRWFSHKEPYWYFGDHPAFLIQGEYEVVTGPRRNRLRSDSVRYYRRERDRAKDALIAVGHGPTGRYRASFVVDYRPARDFVPRSVPRGVEGWSDLDFGSERPEVTFMFGLRDIDRDSKYNSETRKSVVARPTHGYGIRLTPSGAALVFIGEEGPAEKLRHNVMPVRVLASKSIAGGESAGQRVRVKIAFDDNKRTVTVTVGKGKGVDFKMPKRADGFGFVGFHIAGQGYAEVRNLTLSFASKPRR